MLIKVITNEKDSTLSVACSVTESEEKISTWDVVGVLLDALEGVVERELEEHDEDLEEAKDWYHDLITRLFTHTVMELFPEHKDFELSDAALIKAQDEILKEISESGEDVETVLARYNKAGEDYVGLMRAEATKKC